MHRRRRETYPSSTFLLATEKMDFKKEYRTFTASMSGKERGEKAAPHRPFQRGKKEPKRGGRLVWSAEKKGECNSLSVSGEEEKKKKKKKGGRGNLIRKSLFSSGGKRKSLEDKSYLALLAASRGGTTRRPGTQKREGKAQTVNLPKEGKGGCPEGSLIYSWRRKSQVKCAHFLRGGSHLHPALNARKKRYGNLQVSSS